MAGQSFEIGDFVIYNTGLRELHGYLSDVCGDRYTFIPHSANKKHGKIHCIASELIFIEKWPLSMPMHQNHDSEFKSNTFTLEEASHLKIGDILDFADNFGKYCLAKVIEKSEYNLKMHFFGWESRFDKYSNYYVDHRRYAKAGSISMRPAHRFKDVTNLESNDIFEVYYHNFWKPARILAFDGRSGQINVQVSIHNRFHIFRSLVCYK